MNSIQNFFGFLGRVCISAIFLYSAYAKIMDWQASETYITNLICDWHASIENSPLMESVLESLLPYNTFILILTIVLQILGSLMIVLSFHVSLGAVLLLIYSIPAAIFTNRFWSAESVSFSIELIDFLNQLAIIGGIIGLIVKEKKGMLNFEDFNSQETRSNHPFSKDL